MPATISASQIYGRTNPQYRQPKDAPIAEASSPLIGNSQPLIYWVALVGLLIAARLLWEYAGE